MQEEKRRAEDNWNAVFGIAEDMYRVERSVILRYMRKLGRELTEENILEVAEMLSEELGRYEDEYVGKVERRIAESFGIVDAFMVYPIVKGSFSSFLDTLRTELTWYLSSGESPEKLTGFVKNPIHYLSRGNDKSGLYEFKSYVSPGTGTPFNIFTSLLTYVTNLLVEVMNLEALECGKSKGYGYFMAIRGSSYDCPLCDSYCNRVMPVSENPFPLHSRCCCIVIPLQVPFL